MKQLSQNLRTGQLSVDDVIFPNLQAGQILVQTKYSLISAGTERTKIETGRKKPFGESIGQTGPSQTGYSLGSTTRVERLHSRRLRHAWMHAHHWVTVLQA